MQFEIYQLPKLPNQLYRRHWSVVMRESKKWQKLVAEQMLINRWNVLEPLKKAKLTITRYSVREPDFDNLVSSGKFLIDALVKNKVLIDDKVSIIGESKYLWQKVSKLKEQKVKVEVISEFP